MTIPLKSRSKPRQRPRLSLTEMLALVYVASLAFDGYSVGGRSLPFIVATIYIAVSATLWLTSKTQRNARGGNHVVPSLLFLFYCALSYFWSIAPVLTVGHLGVLSVAIMTSMFLAGNVSRLVKTLPWAYVLGSVVSALATLAAPANIDNRRTSYGNENDVAVALLLAVGCALWIALRSRGMARLATLGCTGVLVSGVVATGSRTAILGGLAMLAAFFVLLIWKRDWRPLILLSSVSLAGILVFLQMPVEAIPDRLLNIQESLTGGGVSNRSFIWDAILARGFDALGVGAGATPAFLSSAINSASVAHNVVLGLLLETGLIGLVLFGSIIISAASKARRSPYAELLVLLFPAVLVVGLALTLETSRHFWFVLALAWAIPSTKADADSPNGELPVPERKARQ